MEEVYIKRKKGGWVVIFSLLCIYMFSGIIKVDDTIKGKGNPIGQSINAVKNPAYKSINSSQTIISKVIEDKK